MEASKLNANHYNPNVVMQTEMTLLERSLLQTGWIQPVLATPALTLIDGFHRWKLSMNSPAVRAVYGGMLPVAILQIPEGEAMCLTVRINRAKGTHVGLRMSVLVQELVRVHGISEKRVAEEMGASMEEVQLLLAGGVFKHKDTPNHKYSKSWVPADNGKRTLAGDDDEV